MMFLLLLLGVGGATEWISVSLSSAGVGVAVEWILLLRADLGQLSFLDLLCEFCWVLRFVVGRILCSSESSSSVGMTADFTPMFTALEFLGLFVFFFAAVAGWFFVVLQAHLWISGLGGRRRRRRQSRGADGCVQVSRMVCSFPMVGVRSLLWFGKVLWVELQWRHSEACEASAR